MKNGCDKAWSEVARVSIPFLNWLKRKGFGSRDHAARAALAPATTDVGIPEATSRALSIDAELELYFDSAWYLKTNHDVAAAGIDPFRHFLDFGEEEGRDPSKDFSTAFYREVFMQGQSNVSPLRYYLETGRDLGHDPRPSSKERYQLYVGGQETSLGLEIPELRRHIEVMPIRPRFFVFVDRVDHAGLVSTMLERQIYANWTICTERETLVRDLTTIGHSYLIWIDPTDVLHPTALYCFASEVNTNPDVDVIYGDDDDTDANGVRTNPFFKPDWSPDYLESCNFLKGACVSGRLSSELMKTASSQYDMVLSATDAIDPRRVAHIRKILLHSARDVRLEADEEVVAGDLAALRRRLHRTRRAGAVSAVEPFKGCYEIKLSPTVRPLVSVVIPTAARIVEVDGRKIDLLFNCLDSFQANTSYRNIELIIVHNGDIEPKRFEKLKSYEARLIDYDGPFNVARKINIGARAATGSLLLLLNDDIEPLVDDWIERMVEQFEKPHVGVVGAKLLYPSMTTQHVGVVLNGGMPDHVRARYSRNDPGYFFSSAAVRNYSAVTGAVMMVRASQFAEVGGYTEELPVNFNDVDFCLKIRERGQTIVYAPKAEIVHYESMSRVRSVDPAEIAYFEQRWSAFATDPYYNEEVFAAAPSNFDLTPRGRPVG